MPDAGATIEIEGLDELVKKLDDLGKMKTVHAGIEAAAVHIKGKIDIYPAKTAANLPKTTIGGRWYERGWGSKWMTRKGVMGKKTSEDLSSKWTSKYDRNKFEAVVGNNASYAIFVQGPKDKQAKHMAGIGWKSVDTVADEEVKRVQELVFDAVRRAIGA